MNKEERAQSKKIDNYIYNYSDILGQGNFSKVYKAKNEITNEIVAIKVIELNSLKSPKLEQLLFSEIDVLKKLKHLNILRCYQVFTSNRNCYIITQLCNGGDLDEILRKKRKFTQTQAIPFIKDVYNGLKYLSENHVIHRDLKIANIFMNDGVAKIADFGFAKFTTVGFKDINIGSPLYMSPEGLLHNLYSQKTDVWAFGILIYELLHGKTPHSFCKSENELRKQIYIQVTENDILPEISRELKQVMVQCLQVDENKRPTISNLKNLSFFEKLKTNTTYLSLGPRRLMNPTIEVSRNSNTQFSNERGRPTSLSSHYNGPKPNTININRNVFKKQNDNVINPQKKFLNIPEQPKVRVNSASKNKNQIMYLPIKMKNQEQKTPLASSNQANKWQRKTSFNFFQGILNFRHCINLLHYCRLIYKYIMLAKQIQYSTTECQRILSFWIFRIINAIYQKLDSRQIYFDDNTGAKQKKMRQVTNQYQKKYAVDIEKPLVLDTDFSSLEIVLRNKCFEIEGHLKERRDSRYLHTLHFLIILIQATKILGRCWQRSFYEEWREYKRIQQFLSQQKNSLTLESYHDLKNKIW